MTRTRIENSFSFQIFITFGSERRHSPALPHSTSYTEFWELLRMKKVTRVRYSPDKAHIIVSFTNGKTERVTLPYDPELFPKLMEMNIPVDFEEPNALRWSLEGLARSSTPLVAIGGLIYLTKKTMEEPDDDFMSPKAKKALRSTGVSLADVAGIDPIRGEVRNPRNP